MYDPYSYKKNANNNDYGRDDDTHGDPLVAELAVQFRHIHKTSSKAWQMQDWLAINFANY